MNQNPSFPATRWTRVVEAGDTASPQARAALEELCQTYWYPVFSFLRRSGVGSDDAEDLTQGFFLHVCEHRTLDKADPARGRFRTFILACLKNFVSDERRKQSAAKRQANIVQFDAAEAESRYDASPVDNMTPEMLYDRAFAEDVLARAWSDLEREKEEKGELELCRALQGHLNDEAAETYRTIGERFNMKPNPVKSYAFLLRGRYRALIEARAGQTLADRRDLRSEIRTLEDTYASAQ